MSRQDKFLPVMRARLKAMLGERTYSQEGEDRILSRLFGYQNKGFYVDVGAHHPSRFSNTYLFYRKGWRGINIDATPGSMAIFSKLRPRDLNVEIGIAEAAGTARFFMFSDPALNTFDETIARTRDVAPWKLLGSADVPLRPLREVLREQLPRAQSIDFMNVDVEGRDYQVLCSNDWDDFRPRVVLVEIPGATVESIATDPSAQLLRSLKYLFFSKTVHTCLFIDATSPLVNLGSF
jgi:FkbM family methyltransferase